MAEAVLSAFLQVAFDNLASPILKEFGLIIGVDKELKKLWRMLSRIWVVLNDAEERQLTEEPVKFWLTDLKDVAYDVDDLLDEVTTKALQQSQLSSQVQKFIPSLNSNQLLYRFELAHRIKEIMERLEEVEREGNYLGLKEKLHGKASEFRDRLQTSSFVDESYVFGREEDKKKIIDLLMSESHVGNKFSVLPIVGMGGLGKTTLAQLVYNDDRVKKHFQMRIWVFVSDDFDVKRLTRSVIESATKRTFSLVDLDPLQVTLEEIISEKRFLLVLDDVWCEKSIDWDVFLAPFRSAAEGSKIVVTTRSEVVSSLVGTIPTYHLEGLSDDHCWSLFASRAFKDRNFHAYSSLVRIGKQIVKKCQGLPLAAKTLGGLLHCKHHKEEWEVILSSMIWDLPQVSKDVLPALKLSYYHLPANLKHCFTYCSIFPKDHIFDRDKLVQLWIAEGFVQSDGRKRMEDIGNNYFDDLLWRSFFQRSYNDVKGQMVYTMHDLIHGLAQNVAGNECFRMEDNKMCSISETARHSSLLCDNIEPTIFEAFYKCRSLRTFMLLREHRARLEKISSDFFLKLRSLRVLDLSHTCLVELPNSIENLMHLRYIDLSRTPIKRLPECISGLYNLQTLKLRDCYELLDLPKGTMNLINLQHLELEAYSRLNSVPPKIGRLTNLQTLSAFTVGKETGCGIQELRNMTGLRGSLAISKLENVINIDEVKEAELMNKSYIYKLDLIWSRRDFVNLRNEDVEETVLRDLRPHKNLKELSIRNYYGLKFPGWMWDPSFAKLESMKLLYCRKCKFLPPLGQLPFLKELYIGALNAVKSVGNEFCGEGVEKRFPSLEKLTFTSLAFWEKWNGVQEGDFPSLHEINISLCHKLTELSYIPPTVKTLNISSCKRLTSLPMLAFISNLTLQYCNEMLLRSLPRLVTLQSFTVSGFSRLTALPRELLHAMTTLKELYISSCNDLLSLSEEDGLQHLVSLEHLEISECPKLESVGDQLPTTLKHFELSSCPNLKSLSKRMSSLTCLQDLEVRECEQLTSLPDGMQHLTSLQLLEIWCCPLISSLPEEGLPISLQHLSISDCPLLEERCRHQTGEDWAKIAHVETILIGRRQYPII